MFDNEYLMHVIWLKHKLGLLLRSCERRSRAIKINDTDVAESSALTKKESSCDLSATAYQWVETDQSYYLGNKSGR